MKKFVLCVIFVLVAVCVRSQDFTLLHINAKWNQPNNFDLKGIQNCNVRYALLEDQVPSLKAQIKSVPIIILLDKNGKPRGQWQADLTFKLNVKQEEVQDWVNRILMDQ